MILAEVESDRVPGSVQFYLDPVPRPICTVVAPPYRCEFDAGTQFQGRSIRVEAIDQLGHRIAESSLETTAFPKPERVVRHVIEVPVVVRGDDTSPGSLPYNDLRCFWAGKPCSIDGARLIEINEQTPLSILLLVDVSPSMGDMRTQMKGAVDDVLAAFPAHAEVMVASFSSKYETLGQFTADRGEIHGQLENVAFTGWNTCIYRSLDRAFDDLKKRPGHRLLFVISDGFDTCDTEFVGLSKGVYKARTLLWVRYHTVELSRATRAPIYAFRIVSDTKGRGLLVLPDRGWEGLARETGGRLFASGDLYGMDRAFDDLIDDVRATWRVDVGLPARVNPGVARRLELLPPEGREDEFDLHYPAYWDPVERRRSWMEMLSASSGATRFQAAMQLRDSVEPEVLRELLRAVKREPDERIRTAEFEAILNMSAHLIVHGAPAERRDGLAAAKELCRMRPEARSLLDPALSVLQKMPVPDRIKQRARVLQE